MKKMLTISLFLLLGTVPAFAGVQQGQSEFSPVVGVVFPIGDFADEASVGFSFGARYGYYLSPTVALGVGAVYTSFGIDDQFQALFPTVDVDASTLELTGGIKSLFGQSPKSQFFVRGFVGAFRTKVSLSAGVVNASASVTDFGLGGALGLQFMGQSKTGGYVEGVIISIFSDPSSSQYLGVRGGVSFFFGGNTGL